MCAVILRIIPEGLVDSILERQVIAECGNLLSELLDVLGAKSWDGLRRHDWRMAGASSDSEVDLAGAMVGDVSGNQKWHSEIVWMDASRSLNCRWAKTIVWGMEVEAEEPCPNHRSAGT